MAVGAGMRTAGMRAVGAALVLALLAASCSRDSQAQPRQDPTVPTAPPTTADPYAIPPVIDEAYVNRVLEGLDAAFGEVVRLVVSTRSITPEVTARVEALYDKPRWTNIVLDSLARDLARGFPGLRRDPGNARTTVTRLIAADLDCVFAEVARDYTAVGIAGLTADRQWIGIQPRGSLHNSVDLNPTSWIYIYEGFAPNQQEPRNPCSG